MLTIVSAPNPVLSQKAKPIETTKIHLPTDGIKPVVKLDKPLLKLIDEMKQTLEEARDPEGVGLAAPQVGKSLQIFIIKPTPKSHFQTFINPVMQTQNNIEPFDKLRASTKQREIQRTGSAKSKPIKLEGCLSLPSIWGEVIRSPKVLVSYFDEKGNFYKKNYSGFTAVIIQHEYDHLNGILFPKRVLEQQGTLYKSRKNKKGEEEFREIEL